MTYQDVKHRPGMHAPQTAASAKVTQHSQGHQAPWRNRLLLLAALGAGCLLLLQLNSGLRSTPASSASGQLLEGARTRLPTDQFLHQAEGLQPRTQDYGSTGSMIRSSYLSSLEQAGTTANKGGNSISSRGSSSSSSSGSTGSRVSSSKSQASSSRGTGSRDTVPSLLSQDQTAKAPPSHPKQHHAALQLPQDASGLNGGHGNSPGAVASGSPASLLQYTISSEDVKAIDIVYLWVNGSDPLHMASLAQQAAKEGLRKHQSSRGSSNSKLPTTVGNGTGAVASGATVAYEGVAAMRRFDSSMDELRYSLRSVAKHMPWFRRMYLVTSGQVPSWLNLSHPRVTVVPHSSIFQDPEDLPTFNSAAIEANLHRIPGLSACFIVFNDDIFLTKQVELSFFVTPERGEYIYNAWPFPEGCFKSPEVCAEDTTGASLRYVNALFTAKFRPRKRRVQSHVMHFIQKKWMQTLQAEFPAEYKATSSHHFRSGTDMQFAAAYKWYLIEKQHAQEELPELHRSRFMVINDDVSRLQQALKVAWKRPDITVVCLNDVRSGTNATAHAEVNSIVGSHLRAMYPEPSEFELLEGMINSCTAYFTSVYGRLPDKQGVEAACTVHGPGAV